MTKNILFRCDGNDCYGFGHVSRCLHVASKFLNDAEWTTYFLGDYNSFAKNMITKAGHTIAQSNLLHRNYFNEFAVIREILNQFKINVLFLDSRSEMEKSNFAHLCDLKICIATLDDPSERRKLVDLAFYPPVSSVQNMGWGQFQGQKFIGWDYYPLNSKILENRRHRVFEDSRKPLRICLSMGSTDPLNYTSEILIELLKINKFFELDVVIGPNNKFKKQIYKISSGSKKSINLIENCSDIIEYFAKADVGLIAFGVSAYEAACLGLPTMLFPISLDHYLSAQSFIDAGIATHALPKFPASNIGVSENINRLLLDQVELSKMSWRALNELDGMGSTKIYDAILNFSKKIV